MPGIPGSWWWTGTFGRRNHTSRRSTPHRTGCCAGGSTWPPRAGWTVLPTSTSPSGQHRLLAGLAQWGLKKSSCLQQAVPQRSAGAQPGTGGRSGLQGGSLQMAWAAMGRTARMRGRYLMVIISVCGMNGSLKTSFEWKWQRTDGVCRDAINDNSWVLFSGIAKG